MLLRTRITLIVGTALILTVLGLGGASLLREQLLQQRLTATAVAGQTALWNEMLATESQRLEQSLQSLKAQPGFLQALYSADRATIAQALTHAHVLIGPQEPLALMGVISAGSEPIVFGTEPPRPLLDAVSLDRALGGEGVSGLRMVAGSTPVMIAAHTLPGSTYPIVLVLGRHAEHGLQRFAQRSATSAHLIDLHGTLLGSTDSNLWQRLQITSSPRIATYQQHQDKDHTYTLNSTPVTDLSGHPAGALVTLADNTHEASTRQFLDRMALISTSLLMLTVLLGLYVYLGKNFRTLDNAIAALQALARGDARVRLQHAGNDEIGRIAQAVVVFRHSAEELTASRSLRERVRRRQERLIHTQLQQLADATDMTSREEVLELLHNGEPHQGSAASEDEEQLRHLAAVMGSLTQRIIGQHQRLSTMIVELREALVTKTRLAGLEQELQIAAQVQLSILPRHLTVDSRVQIDCHITPAREVGGDFYDYFVIDAEHLGFVIADVSGKGVPAALFMAITRTLLKATAVFVTAPASCIRKLNDLLATENEQMMFVTIFYGVLHLPTGRVTYVNAGHNPPYLLRLGTTTPLPRTDGIAVAVSDGFVYDEGVVDLAPGDKLFLYTDGITEAFDPDGQEYGNHRLEQVLQPLAAPHCTAQATNETVLADVHRFERGAPQADDITCLCLQYQGDTSH